jgi:hypothetical protein
MALGIGAYMNAPIRQRLGRADVTNFTVYHQVLNRGRWKGRALTRTLLGLVIAALVPEGPVIIRVDDTIERRWRARIAARGIYRDSVRSSHGHFVKTSGLRWLSFMVLAPVPWAGRIKALPVLTLLAPSGRGDAKRGRRHKLLTDWARQSMLQLCRWLPDRRIIFVGDSSFAVHALAHALAGRAILISRLRLDAVSSLRPRSALPEPGGAPPRRVLPCPSSRPICPIQATRWQTISVPIWYGAQTEKRLEITSGTALWYRRCQRPLESPHFLECAPADGPCDPLNSPTSGLRIWRSYDKTTPQTQRRPKTHDRRSLSRRRTAAGSQQET